MTYVVKHYRVVFGVVVFSSVPEQQLNPIAIVFMTYTTPKHYRGVLGVVA